MFDLPWQGVGKFNPHWVRTTPSLVTENIGLQGSAAVICWSYTIRLCFRSNKMSKSYMGAWPQSSLGELTAFLRPSSWWGGGSGESP